MTPTELQEEKEAVLDPILQKKIALSLTKFRKIRDQRQRTLLAAQIKEPLIKYINPFIIDFIVHTRSVGQVPRRPKRQGDIYRVEDEATYAIKNLISRYCSDASKKEVRALTEECMRLIESLLNSNEFIQIVRETGR